MGNVAAIDGFTGPGRRTTLIQGDIEELTFRLKKKIIEVINKDGSMGQYDLAQVSAVQVTSEGGEYTLAVVSKTEEDLTREREENDRSKREAERAQSESDRRKEVIDGWTDTIADRSTRIAGTPDKADRSKADTIASRSKR